MCSHRLSGGIGWDRVGLRGVAWEWDHYCHRGSGVQWSVWGGGYRCRHSQIFIKVKILACRLSRNPPRSMSSSQNLLQR